MMPAITIVAGLLMVAVGLWGYLGAAVEDRSPTALIPAAFGLLLVVLGGLSFVASLRKHTMHFAAAVGLVGFLMPAGRLGMVLAQGKATLADRGPQALLAMAVISAIFLGLCVNSFIQARKARTLGGPAT